MVVGVLGLLFYGFNIERFWLRLAAMERLLIEHQVELVSLIARSEFHILRLDTREMMFSRKFHILRRWYFSGEEAAVVERD